MNTVIKDMLGGFVNSHICAEVFEKHFNGYMNDYEKELDKNTFDMLVYADYSDENDVAHLRESLGKVFPKEKYEDEYFINSQNEELKNAYVLSHPDLSHIVLDLGEAETTDDLQNIIKRTFGLPDSYGRNRAAFEQLIDLSNCRSVTVNNYGHFYQRNPKDAMLLIWLISKHKTGDCVLTVNN